MLTNINVKNDNTPVALLKERREKLFASVLKWDPAEFIRTHAELIDTYFRESFAASRVGPRLAINKNPYAIIGLGGYGRSEQCIHSDIDLLILFENAVPAEADELIQEYVYPLWDIGLDIGYATRSLKECIKMARTDFEVLTSVLDARFVCGISAIYGELVAQLKDRIIDRSPAKIITWLVERNGVRHQSYGDSTFLLEPNLKDGAGGLRDYHTMRWIGRIKFDIKDFRDLEYHGALSHDEYAALNEALSYIWGVRNRLHYFAGRKCDQLYFEYQTRLADEMGLKAKDGQMPVERLMSELHSRMGFVKQQLMLLLYELGYVKPSKRSFIFRKHPEVPGLQLSRSGIDFISPNRILKSPELLIRIFELSARMRLPLTREAGRLVREFGYLADDRFRGDPAVKKSFEEILLAPPTPVNVLDQMLETGFLSRLIPEFGGIVDRIQFDAYHLFPVDRHSLRVVHMLKSFGETTPPETDVHLCAQIYRGLKRKHLLLLTALLHDIGKAVPDVRHSLAGAEMTDKILPRMGYAETDVEIVHFLIEHHLLLAKTATRRDIHDEETAIRLARQVGKVNRLKMLYLLTVADSMATGPKAWNDWTATLVRDFFLKVLRILEKGELATTGAVRQIEKKQAFVRQAAGFQDPDMDRTIEALSPRYLLSTDARDIVTHIQLYRRLKDADFVWDIVPDEQSNTRQVVVCAKDRPGLFSNLSGVFTINGINVLNAQIFTWKNGIALDMFTVTPPPDRIFEAEKWQRAADDLSAALSGKLDLAGAIAAKTPGAKREQVALRPDRVVVDNKDSSYFTIIEVFSYDFPGLLYRITDALTRCGLDIWVAKIATKVDQVVDVFYVRDTEGRKVAEQRVEELKSRLLSVLA